MRTHPDVLQVLLVHRDVVKEGKLVDRLLLQALDDLTRDVAERVHRLSEVCQIRFFEGGNAGDQLLCVLLSICVHDHHVLRGDSALRQRFDLG